MARRPLKNLDRPVSDYRATLRKIRLAPWKSPAHVKALRANLRLYAASILPRLRCHPGSLPGQSFDSYFLRESRLFRHSRELYRKQKGLFEARLVTSPRSLSSTILLENRIQYSPTEDELVWHATNPGEAANDEGLLRLVGYSTSVFHEQSHRILWNLLPRPKDRSPDGIRRYLNFVESVVIGLDMALGDELGPKRAALGYLSGTLYDPGSYAEFGTKRERRNYLQVAIRATFLALEGFNSKRVSKALPLWMPECPPEAADHAVARALRLDESFIYVTNPEWQEKNLARIAKFLATKKSSASPATVSADPENWIEPYLMVEKVFDRFGL
jgi:hypothetical protein